MNKLINKLITLLPSADKFFFSGALIFGLFQLPAISNAPTALLNVAKSPMIQTAEAAVVFPSLQTIFLGQAVPEKTANSMVKEKMAYVSSRKAYPASLAVVKKHAETIKAAAKNKGVPEDVAIGVALLENGGSETAVSKAGALGVFQLMPGTAKALGLTVTKKVDERKIPKKNIEAGISYLRQNYDRFGDWGLATWAYHAGEGNVAKALKLYAKANHGVTLVGLKEQNKMRAYVEKHGITVHKLLSSAAVKPLTKKLNDDSAGYPYKVMATAKLFKEASKTGPIVAERN